MIQALHQLQELGEQLLHMGPDEKYREILAPLYRTTWLNMDGGEYLTNLTMIILGCLEFKLPPGMQPEKSPSANMMID